MILQNVISSQKDSTVKLNVETDGKDIPKAKLKIHYSVRPQSSDQGLVTGYTVHAFIKKTGRPARIPDFILKTIKQHFIK